MLFVAVGRAGSSKGGKVRVSEDDRLPRILKLRQAARHPKGTGSEPRFPSVAEEFEQGLGGPHQSRVSGVTCPSPPARTLGIPKFKVNQMCCGEAAVVAEKSGSCEKRPGAAALTHFSSRENHVVHGRTSFGSKLL